jgi:hypothetical protein
MKIKVREYNAERDEVTVYEREETASEIDQREKFDAIAKTEQAEAEAKSQAKTVAEGKLAALGLTTDDLRALGL